MRRPGFLWQAAGFAAATAGGTLLHFLYDWTGKNPLLSPFSGVNESTWEHMKLLFWPMLIFALIQRCFFRSRRDFWPIQLLGIATGLLLIPLLFYTANGAFGTTPDWANILIFYLAAAGAYLLEWQLFRSASLPSRYPLLALASICLIGLLFAIFTFAPPKLPMFQDPTTGTYGAKDPTAGAVGSFLIIRRNAWHSRICGTVLPLPDHYKSLGRSLAPWEHPGSPP